MFKKIFLFALFFALLLPAAAQSVGSAPQLIQVCVPINAKMSCTWQPLTALLSTIVVGNTTTLPPGSPASVTNAGTPTRVILNFAIPAGSAGADGQAATVSVGTVTTLPAGSPATVRNSGSNTNAVLDFGIPEGPAGQPSPAFQAVQNPDGTWTVMENGTLTATGLYTNGSGPGQLTLGNGVCTFIDGQLSCVPLQSGSGN